MNSVRYRGYYYDQETGLYYVGSRYYDPEVGRFINADDVNLLGANDDYASYNLYVYCGNNPINRHDVDGYLWGKIIFGAASGLISYTISTLISGEEFSVVEALEETAMGAIMSFAPGYITVLYNMLNTYAASLSNSESVSTALIKTVSTGALSLLNLSTFMPEFLKCYLGKTDVEIVTGICDVTMGTGITLLDEAQSSIIEYDSTKPVARSYTPQKTSYSVGRMGSGGSSNVYRAAM